MHNVTRATQRAYDTNAANYAAATGDYDLFPGLLDAIECFGQEITSAGPVLDLGCGGGRDSAHLTTLGFVVVAGDVSAEMLRITRSRCGQDVITSQLDMAQLPFQAEMFAGAWVCASLVHIHSAQLVHVLHELFRVLKAGAVASISMKSGDSEGWSRGGAVAGQRWFNHVRPAQLVAAMAEVGFSDITVNFRGRQDWYIATGSRS
jgi:SAM-dependent methyltransferase